MILGVASTFFTVAVVVGVLAATVGLADTAVLAVVDAAVVDFVAPTTTGSDDGIGFPSFVCSFSTFNEMR